MPTNSEAIRLAEASDWKGLQRLIEMAPQYAHEVGDYGMLPIHWACTESRVPVSLLTQLLAAFPDGAKIKNDAALLPLHIAIRARVESAWLEKLVDVYPNAVHVDAPDGLSVVDLAEQVGLHHDGLKILHRAVDDSLPENSHENQHGDDDYPERDDDWSPGLPKQPLVLYTTSPLDGLPANFGRGSTSNNNTPVSPAESLRSLSSDGHDGVDPPPPPPSSVPMHRRVGHMVSPTSSCSSTGSANTAPIPRTTPPLPTRLPSSLRKHSLDYHAHAAAAAVAARQHHDMLHRAQQPQPSHVHTTSQPPQCSLSMLPNRHQSLPLIPSFEHQKHSYASQHDRDRDQYGDQYGDHSSDEEDNNMTYHYASVRSSSGIGLRRMTHADGSNGLPFESPPEWKRDDECSICRATFGMFKHRHHCRNCGKSICSQHSADKKIMMESKGFTTPQRVCVTCYAMITHKQSKEATVQPSPLDGLLQGAKITGPVAAFHQQMQQQQHTGSTQHPHVQSVRRTSATAYTGTSSPGSVGLATSSRSSLTVPHGSPGIANMSLSGPKDKTAADPWAMQNQMNELRHIVVSQQKHIEQLTHTNMQMQQQLLEQEELKAETMLLITQLMTRVSVLELNRNSQELHDDAHDPYHDHDDQDDHDQDDDDAHDEMLRHLSG